MFGSTRREHAQLQRACVVLDPNSQQPVSTVSGGSASSPRLRALHVLVPADPLSLPSAVLRSPPRLPPHAASTPPRRDNQGPAAPASPPPQAAEEALCSRRGAPTPSQPHPVPSPQRFPAPRPLAFPLPRGSGSRCQCRPQPAFPADVFAPPPVLKVRILKGRIFVCCPVSLSTW